MSQAIRVMCVDDNELVAEALGRRFRLEPDLEWGGWMSNSNGLADRLIEQHPDVLLLDIDMPGVDAFGLLQEIKSRLGSVRVAILTGHVRRDYLDRALRAGADGYLCKDDDPSMLIAHIRRLAAGDLVMSPTLGFEPTGRGSTSYWPSDRSTTVA